MKFQFVGFTLKLAKTAYKSVGGLYSCSDIFDFELPFLGRQHLAENVVNSIGVSALCYQAVLQTDK